MQSGTCYSIDALCDLEDECLSMEARDEGESYETKILIDTM